MASAKNLSPLAQIASELEGDIADLQRLSDQIDELSIQSEGGMNQARKLLELFGASGLRINTSVQALASGLNEARERAERAAERVSAKATLVKQRQEQSDQLASRFQLLVEELRDLTSRMTDLKKPLTEDSYAEAKTQLSNRFLELGPRLATMVDHMKKLKQDAREAGLKGLERDADSLAQSVDAARRKMSLFASEEGKIN